MPFKTESLFDITNLAQTPSGESGSSKTCLFTIIIVAKGKNRIHHFQNLVSTISKKHQSKIIFIGIDPDRKELLHQERYILQTPNKNSGTISSDFFLITASPDQLHNIPFLVLPELVPDLPSYILSGHLPDEVSPLLTELELYASRVVFDTEKVPSIQQYAEQILTLPRPTKYADLHWARIKPWREALYRIFSTPDSFELLSLIQKISIKFSRQEYLQAVLLQAWFASRLEWTLTGLSRSDGGTTIHYTSRDRAIDVSLTPTNETKGEQGSIISIEMIGEKEVTYQLLYERDDAHITVHSSTQDRCEMPYTLFVGNFQKGRTITNEVFFQPQSNQYTMALQALSLSQWNCTG